MICTKNTLEEMSKEEIIDEYIELYKEKMKLEKELKKYKNANTPSSANKHLKPNTAGLKAKRRAKRGAPKGHRGNTLILGEADEKISLKVKECTNCKSNNLIQTGYIKKRKIITLTKPKIIIKEYFQEECRCLDCNTLTLATHEDIPDTGIYCKRIQSIVNYLKFKARATHESITDFMNNVLIVPMTRPTTLAITRRASKKLEYAYIELEEQIKKEKIVGADETSMSVQGVNHWIWVFCNALITLFKINKERGGEIVEKTLGKDFQGKLSSDGWITYSIYSEDNNVIHQRCWSHGIREAEFECEKKHPDLNKWYFDIYKMVEKGKNYKQEKRRLNMHKKCKAELEMWCTHAKTHKNLRKFSNKMENGGDDWFNCILYPELPLDNNESERSLRPFVIIRKIIGCLRSELGKKNYEIMMSLISTWQKQGKNIFYTLQSLL